MTGGHHAASVNHGRLLQKLNSPKFEEPGFRAGLFVGWSPYSTHAAGACFFSAAALSCDMKQAQSAPVAQKLVWPKRRSRGKISIPVQ
jgi:hypothetical protein